MDTRTDEQKLADRQAATARGEPYRPTDRPTDRPTSSFTVRDGFTVKKATEVKDKDTGAVLHVDERLYKSGESVEMEPLDGATDHRVEGSGGMDAHRAMVDETQRAREVTVQKEKEKADKLAADDKAAGIVRDSFGNIVHRRELDANGNPVTDETPRDVEGKPLNISNRMMHLNDDDRAVIAGTPNRDGLSTPQRDEQLRLKAEADARARNKASTAIEAVMTNQDGSKTTVTPNRDGTKTTKTSANSAGLTPDRNPDGSVNPSTK